MLAVSDETTRTVAIVGGVATVTGAVAGVVGAIVGANKTAKATQHSAHTQKQASIETAAQERFAAWQNKKRETYAEFLALARPASRRGSAEDSNDKYVAQGQEVMLAAFEELQAIVRPLLEDPSPLAQPGKWTELLDEMAVDVNLTPEEAEKRRETRVKRVEERRKERRDGERP